MVLAMPRQPAQQKYRVAPASSMRHGFGSGLGLPQWKQRASFGAAAGFVAPPAKACGLNAVATGADEAGIAPNLRRRFRRVNPNRVQEPVGHAVDADQRQREVLRG
jgi:hypothetical protein